MDDNNDKIMDLCREHLDRIIELRRDFHMFPELGLKEFRTAEIINGELKKLGLETKTGLGGTGVIGIIRGNHPGKTLLIRADMDALPIEEETGLPYKSTVPEVMHACAHDGHMAALLGVGMVLNELKDEIHGTIKLAFQPSEECNFGAKAFIEDGALEDPAVDYAIAHHLWGEVKEGVVAMRAGGMMASPDMFEINIFGRGGHGSMPEKCVDTIATAVSAVNMMYATLNRKLGAFDEAAMSVCVLKAGNSYNIIPDEAYICGTIRTFDTETRKMIPETMEKILKAVTEANGASYEFKLNTDIPPVRNDKSITEIVKNAAVKIVGAENVQDLEKGAMGGEDFAHFAEKVPSCYFFVGISPDLQNQAVHHNSKFQWDDKILLTSTAVTCRAALDILEQKS